MTGDMDSRTLTLYSTSQGTFEIFFLPSAISAPWGEATEAAICEKISGAPLPKARKVSPEHTFSKVNTKYTETLSSKFTRALTFEILFVCLPHFLSFGIAYSLK
jgi:hypothetical protein